jgi:hypothetical protein
VFEHILGVPSHPLMVHAAVVLVPLLDIGAILYALLPRVRRHCHWVVAALAVLASGSIIATKLSGDVLRARMISRNLAVEVLARGEHKGFGNVAVASTVCLAVVTLALVYVAPGRVTSAAADSSDAGAVARERRRGRWAAGLRSLRASFRGSWLGRLPSRPADDRTVARIRAVLGVATLCVSLLSAYYVLKAGHSGAAMVWSGM